MRNEFLDWVKSNNLPQYYSLTYQLQIEDWAYRHGFKNEVEITLASDFMLGVYNGCHRKKKSLAPLPTGIVVDNSIRECFYNSGLSFNLLTNTCVVDTIERLLSQFCCELKRLFAVNHIQESTGDCRGACQYNTGDRTEYRSYGY